MDINSFVKYFAKSVSGLVLMNDSKLFLVGCKGSSYFT